MKTILKLFLGATFLFGCDITINGLGSEAVDSGGNDGGSLPGTCEEGEQAQAPDGCNICGCIDGQWACTERACDDAGADGGGTDPQPCDDGDKAINECNTCQCIGGDWACTQEACADDTGNGTCDTVMCTLACEYGYVLDENGCEICQCLPAPGQCQDVMCDLACEYGYVLDEKGCETCQCLPAPGE